MNVFPAISRHSLQQIWNEKMSSSPHNVSPLYFRILDMMVCPAPHNVSSLYFLILDMMVCPAPHNVSPLYFLILDMMVCPADVKKTNTIVPIAVGAALAGLVVIVLIAYLIGRRRNRKGYESV